MPRYLLPKLEAREIAGPPMLFWRAVARAGRLQGGIGQVKAVYPKSLGLPPASDAAGQECAVVCFRISGESIICPSRERVKRKALPMNVRTEIVTQIEQVAREQDLLLAPLTDGLELLNSGLDSLSIAVIVARLEDSLGIDPFASSEDTQFPVTFGDFVNLYEHVAK